MPYFKHFFAKLNKTYLVLAGIITYTLVIFFPNLLLYFHEDDFVDFSLSTNVSSVLSSFNLFSAHPEFPFYRPISVQLYFYVSKLLFGLNPLGYHILNFVLFALLSLLVFRLILKLTKNNVTAVVATTFFAINSTHFAAMASGAYAHEILLTIFSVSTILFFIPNSQKFKPKQIILSVFFFVLALMTKETAVMLPIILSLIFFLQIWPRKKLFPEIFRLFPFFLVLGVYLLGHFLFYGLPQSSSYQFIIGKQNFNILAWYSFWSFSVPNILIDFIGPGLKLNPTFLAVTRSNGIIFIVSFVIFASSVFTLFVFSIRKLLSISLVRLIVLGFLWFVIGLIPIIIFPLHKLAIEQTFPMIGLILIISTIVSHALIGLKINKFLAIVVIVVYLIMATNSILIARTTHWIVRSAGQAKAVINFLQPKVKDILQNGTVFFEDGEIKIPEWGSSKQMYLALADGRAIKIIFNRPDVKVLFAFRDSIPTGEKIDIILNSSNFLGY